MIVVKTDAVVVYCIQEQNAIVIVTDICSCNKVTFCVNAPKIFLF